MNMSKVLTFAIGAAIGSVATLAIVRSKYKQEAQAEIDEMREKYSEMRKELSERLEKAGTIMDYSKKIREESELIHKAEMHKYDEVLKRGAYAVDTPVEPDNKGDEIVNPPYVISPDEFGERLDHDQISLTYYADGVLTDDDGTVIDDVDITVGAESLNTFGEYEEDSVFVRNEALETDFEILRDLRRYEDIKGAE